MKIKNLIKVLALSALTLTSGCLLTGCAFFKKDATFEEKLQSVEDLSYEAASIGTAVTLEVKPAYRPAFEAAYTELNRQIVAKTLTLDSLRTILNTLPTKELKSPAARLAIGSATRLFQRVANSEIELNAEAVYLAAGTGIRDGMKVALGETPPLISLPNLPPQ